MWELPRYGLGMGLGLELEYRFCLGCCLGLVLHLWFGFGLLRPLVYALWFFGEGAALKFRFFEELKFGGLTCSNGVLVLFEGGMKDGLL